MLMYVESTNHRPAILKGTIRIKKTDILLYLYFSLIMLFYTINGTTLDFDHFNYIMIVAIGVGIVHIVTTFKSDYRLFLVLMTMGAVIVILYMRSHDTRMLVVLVSLLCAVREDRNRIIQVLFYTKLLSFLLVLLFGEFGHMNQMALHGGIVVLLYLCKRERNQIQYYFKLLIVLCSTILLYMYTHSGSAMVSLVVSFVLLLLKKSRFGIRFLESKLVMWIFPIMLFCNYFFAFGISSNHIPIVGLYVPQWLNRCYMDIVKFLDVATSYRLTFVSFSLQKFGASWLGGDVDYNVLNLQQGQYYNLDSGFIWLIQGWGYLMSILLMVSCIALMRYFIEKKDYNYIIAGVGIALWAVNEDMLVSVGTNFLLIFIGQAMWALLSRERMEKSGNT